MIRIVSSKDFQNGSGGDTERAQAMEDRLLESADLGEPRVDVERIVISREPVDVGLERRSSSLLYSIGLAGRNLNILGVGGSSALRFEALGTDQENTGDHAHVDMLVIRESYLVLYQSSLSALVNTNHLGSKVEGSFERKRVQELKVSN